jgi:hypothetical protein
MRENVMKQAASLKNLELDMLLPGIKINTVPNDFAPIKQMQMERFNGERWELFGPCSPARSAVENGERQPRRSLRRTLRTYCGGKWRLTGHANDAQHYCTGRRLVRDIAIFPTNIEAKKSLMNITHGLRRALQVKASGVATIFEGRP